jgi:hypothetical protein
VAGLQRPRGKVMHAHEMYRASELPDGFIR